MLILKLHIKELLEEWHNNILMELPSKKYNIKMHYGMGIYRIILNNKNIRKINNYFQQKMQK
jgi:hypothetical protein